MKTKHLYIHIPFCKSICTYCNFYRKKEKNKEKINEYIKKIVFQINTIDNIFSSIYIGGGTPNYLDNKNLDILLSSLQKNIESTTEFTVECNPELVTDTQAILFFKYRVNRISLGVQSLNDNTLKLLNRTHNASDAHDAIDILYKNKIENVSCDFIYNLPDMSLKDLDKIFDFITTKSIKHISFYSLEIKKNSKLEHMKYEIDADKDDLFFEKIKKQFDKIKYQRYEISNWSIDKEFYSKHNLSYWQLENWIAIGDGSYGFEKGNYYFNKPNVCILEKWSDKEIYENILIMGLRLINGIDLKINRNYYAFNLFRDKISDQINIKNDFLSAKNIDFLHDLLIKII